METNMLHSSKKLIHLILQKYREVLKKFDVDQDTL